MKGGLPFKPPLRAMSRLFAAMCAAVGLLAALPVESASPLDPSPPSKFACLMGGHGYLRARIRGALNLDIDWHNAEMECDGGPRPDGRGIRVSFAGPKHT